MMTEETALTKKIPVVECFGPTIQGEGLVIGMPTHFIRFGLCDYKCVMCDSLHAVLPELVKLHAQWLTQEEILLAFNAMVAQRAASHVKMVTLSGGNPLIHDLTWLVNALHDQGYIVAVETQGSYWHNWVQECDYITISPKGPGMGERFFGEALKEFIERCSVSRLNYSGLSIKVPLFNSGVDLEFMKWVMQWIPEQVPVYASLGNPFPPKEPGQPDHFGTKEVFPGVQEWKIGLLQAYANLAEDLLQEPTLSRVRFTPQLHVLVWGNERGR